MPYLITNNRLITFSILSFNAITDFTTNSLITLLAVVNATIVNENFHFKQHTSTISPQMTTTANSTTAIRCLLGILSAKLQQSDREYASKTIVELWRYVPYVDSFQVIQKRIKIQNEEKIDWVLLFQVSYVFHVI